MEVDLHGFDCWVREATWLAGDASVPGHFRYGKLTCHGVRCTGTGDVV